MRRPRPYPWRCLVWDVPDDVTAADIANLYNAELAAALRELIAVIEKGQTT